MFEITFKARSSSEATRLMTLIQLSSSSTGIDEATDPNNAVFAVHTVVSALYRYLAGYKQEWNDVSIAEMPEASLVCPGLESMRDTMDEIIILWSEIKSGGD